MLRVAYEGESGRDSCHQVNCKTITFVPVTEENRSHVHALDGIDAARGEAFGNWKKMCAAASHGRLPHSGHYGTVTVVEFEGPLSLPSASTLVT